MTDIVLISRTDYDHLNIVIELKCNDNLENAIQ